MKRISKIVISFENVDVKKPLVKALKITSMFLIVPSKNNKPFGKTNRDFCPLVIMQNSCNDFGFEIYNVKAHPVLPSLLFSCSISLAIQEIDKER